MEKKLTIGIGLVVTASIGAILVMATTFAQVLPEFLISWGANTYAPPEYQGKILPAKGATVNVSMELIEKGKPTNLSAYEVRWFVDDELQTTGFGMKNFSFEIDTFTGKSSVLVKVEVINYHRANLEKIILIPIAEPKLTIARLDKNTFKALAYFFNISAANDLNFIWSVNNVSTSGPIEKPEILSLDLSKINTGTSLTLDLLVENPKNFIEKIGKALNFIVQ